MVEFILGGDMPRRIFLPGFNNIIVRCMYGGDIGMDI